MREIKFRAKGNDEETKGRWFYGAYAKLNKTTYCFKQDYDMHPENTQHYIIFEEMTDWGLPNKHLRASIDPNTIGQYTNLKDKKGKEIYEGDILKIENIDYAKVYYDIDRMAWGLEAIGEWYLDSPLLSDNTNLDLLVVGNIYDNPELLD